MSLRAFLIGLFAGWVTMWIWIQQLEPWKMTVEQSINAMELRCSLTRIPIAGGGQNRWDCRLDGPTSDPEATWRTSFGDGPTSEAAMSNALADWRESEGTLEHREIR